MLAHKITLIPNNKQKTYLQKAVGVARFAYNWGLEQWGKQYNNHLADPVKNPKPSQYSLRRQLNSIKKEQFPWMIEVTKCAPQNALINLGKAFNNFFRKKAKYPKFHKKGINDSFTLSNDQFTLDGERIRIPNLGWVRMRESLRFEGKIISATVSRAADKWFVSVNVETHDNSHLFKAENQGAVGVDLGVSALATLSTGEEVTGPKPHKVLLSRLKRYCRSLSRKVKGSKNRNKARERLAQLHYRITCIRSDSLHKLTTDLTRRFHTIGIEDLNVRGMIRNRRLSRSIADMGFSELRRQLEYKAKMRGVQIMVADRFFASSKICSNCDHKVDNLKLSVRQWVCPACGEDHQRDMNAAINLMKYAVSSTVLACGEEGSGLKRKFGVKPASLKQEDSFEYI